MKLRKLILPLGFAALVLAPISTAHATTSKSIDISQCPAVKVAQKARDDADQALQAANDKNDKAAIDAARKALDDAETKLKEARKAAAAALKKKK